MARAPGPATLETVMRCPPSAAVDLYWIPLGAGGHSVRLNGKVYETLDAARRHRPRCDLYHTALVVELDGEQEHPVQPDGLPLVPDLREADGHALVPRGRLRPVGAEQEVPPGQAEPE